MAVRWLFLLVAMGMLAAAAQGMPPGLGNRPPATVQKSPVQAPQLRFVVRQGGDTLASATPITSLPFVGSGTTEGYGNDYDAVCPTIGSASPDVVYSFTRPEYGTLTIDLCGSNYDTKIYVMSDEGQIFDCNDDYYSGGDCGQSTSRIDNLWLPPGETYYLIVDGAGGAAGQYQFEIRRWGADPLGNGDTTLDPIVIDAIPYTGTGNTENYSDDYDEVCPYNNSTSPDVVYTYTATATVYVDLDLCNSSYDTKLYIYEADLSLYACNDDFNTYPCFPYSSKLENIGFIAGNTYYIVVDGYGSTYGAYILDLTMAAGPCVLACPAYSVNEGEPPLVDGYVDNYNGGCNTPGFPFQIFHGWGSDTLCGVSGWYTGAGGQSRDTDWYILTMGYHGPIEVTLDAEQPTYMFELAPQDCANVAVVQQATAGPCSEVFMTISGYYSGAPVWLWIGPTTFVPPAGGESTYEYVAWFEGLDGSVVTEPTTWSTIKTLYR